ncbi:MAG: AAA family ATPase [Candidatus Komeilibacteria bacterium]|nr:AAA family ATPase [Candidatus Komeilibacteria bacterium]
MYLQKLEIQGFKSFAEKAVLEFNRELTAVVGPNGSGKSNVADAVRWVLGEQSLKVLRGKKSEDVIFAGSHAKARLGFAEVNIYLNNEDGQAPIDYREVVITRRIYRDGEGEYLINKNKVRLTDIQLLLARSNFGQRTYSIIGQGMIDSILTSSPAERKEFFDEATGVRQYQIKKDQSLLKLEHSQQNLSQSEQLIQEIEPRLRSLTRQVKKLERKEELSAELKDLQIKYYSQLLNNLKSQHQLLAEKLKQANAAKEETENKIQELQKQIDQESAADTQAGQWQKLQNEYQGRANEHNQLLKEATLIQGKLDLDLTASGQVDLVWLNNRKTEVKNQLATLEQKIKTAQTELERQIKILLEKLELQKKVLTDFAGWQEKIARSQNASNKTEGLSLVKIKQHLNELCRKQADFIELLEKSAEPVAWPKLKNRAEELLKEIKWLANKLSDVAEEGGENISEFQGQLNATLATKDNLVNEVQDLKIKTEVLKQTLNHLAEEAERLKNEAEKIEAELLSYNNKDKTAANQLLTSQQIEATAKINELEEKMSGLKAELERFSQTQATQKSKFLELQKNLRELQIQLNTRSAQDNELKIELAKIETKKEDLEKEIAVELSVEFKPSSEKIQLHEGETLAEINRLKNQLAIIGGIDQEVAAEYREVKERCDFLMEQSSDLAKAIISCRQIIEELDEKITKQFEIAFEKINEKFIHYFKILFNGGQAKLILSKKKIIEEEPATENGQEAPAEEIKPEIIQEKSKKKQYEFGIEIKATPPGKKLQSINSLSGGEKALTSIALISAIIANNPSPFVILDEVDAALDEANSIRFAKIVEELSSQTQFICITHNRATMQQAAILYGVTMTHDGISKLLSVNLTEAEKVAQ